VSKLDDFFNPINLFCAVGIMTKEIFFGVNYGVVSMPKFVRRKLRQKVTLLCKN
jgi:hypothetical protein